MNTHQNIPKMTPKGGRGAVEALVSEQSGDPVPVSVRLSSQRLASGPSVLLPEPFPHPSYRAVMQLTHVQRLL